MYSGVLETFDGAKIISNNLNLIGISEIKTAFETMPGVQCSLLPKGWIENHYKWIVWKLASMQRAFPLNFDNCLTIENIMEDLKYRCVKLSCKLFINFLVINCLRGNTFVKSEILTVRYVYFWRVHSTS